MSRRSAGLVGVWAEVQRQQQRQREAEARQRREQERQARAHQRQLAQNQREYRQAEAGRRTAELDDRVASLQGLLAAGCRAPAFRAAALLRTEEVQAFDPGPLAWPVRMPDPAQYQPQGGWTAGRRAQAEAEARARFEHDWYAAQAAEAQRQQQLAAHRHEYEQRTGAHLSEVRRHNAGVTELTEGVRSGDPEAVVEYFSAVLYAATTWPEGFPRQVSAAYDPAARQLVLDWELPGYGVVPEAKSVRYMPTLDQDKETPRPVGQRRALYREVLAQSVLLAVHQLFAADESGALESVALNGVVDDHDPATGRQALICLATVMAPRGMFTGLHLEQVDPVSCLTEALRGQLSARPDQLAAVRPSRRPEDVRDRPVTRGGDEEPDLYDMDPIAFESLVADLFRAMGMEAVTTERSNDGGVDVDAVDPTPIRGGKIVVQVKRYRNTVPPTAVRDLYGTVQDVGANKGVLVTTSGFGPGSRTFAQGKPLELISGTELVDLLHRHGLRGRLGERGRPAARPEPAAREDYNVLGMSWSGDVALDVCALVCTGSRVLSDEHFVFFNNPATPDGSVRTVAAVPPDRAALRVAFDALPDRADRLVLVAAIDPEAAPHADLSGFTGAGIRLLDSAMTELGRLDVSDGRPHETALVLGSFRRRAGGDWDFVVGGRGYPGGLAQLVRDHGIDVE
ncbi:restriction endonuclease [Streptomyces diastatochromogenes]|uniref:Restriction endonuclease n=1 Tax=Streptomyces diastatochromogenes TaxID=42236 RepID=A0A233S2G3_STRDA|nr:restriction endonuclease [Streptomyces diastatochromogenes]OXY89851.1 restriction endonuclease [Streptomyces diastatochromogenes]